MSNSLGPRVQAYNFVYPNITGLQLAYVSSSKITVSAGTTRDSLNNYDITLDAALTLDLTQSGVINGLDTGTVSGPNLYHVFVINDSTLAQDPAVLASLSDDAPTLPSNYDVFKRIGSIYYISSSLAPFFQVGNSFERSMVYTSPVSVLSSGASTSATAVDLTDCVPAWSTEVRVRCSLTPATAADAVYLATDTTTPSIAAVQGDVATKATVGEVMIPCNSVGAIYYHVTSSSDAVTIFVSGYRDSL